MANEESKVVSPINPPKFMRLLSNSFAPRFAMSWTSCGRAVVVAGLVVLVSGCVTTTSQQPGMSTGMTQPGPAPTQQPLRTSELGQPGVKKDTLTPNDLLYLSYLNSNRHLMTNVDESGAVFITVYDDTTPRFILQLNADGTLTTTHILEGQNMETRILDSNGDGVPDLKVESYTDGRHVLSKLVNTNWAQLPDLNNGANGPANPPPAAKP